MPILFSPGMGIVSALCGVLKSEHGGLAVFPPAATLALAQVAPGGVKTGVMSLLLLNGPDEINLFQVFKTGQAGLTGARVYLS